MSIKKSKYVSLIVEKTMFFKDLLIKPIATIDAHEEEFKEPKNTFIFAGIVAVAMMLFSLIAKMIDACTIESYDFRTFEPIQEFSLEGLKSLNWFSAIFGQLGIIIIWMGAIALIYYLATIIVNNKGSYIKNLSITATAFVPLVVGCTILAPLAALISYHVSVILIIASGVYSILVLLELTNKEIKFKNLDQKIYFNLITLSLIAGGIYFALTSVLTTAINSNLTSLF